MAREDVYLSRLLAVHVPIDLVRVHRNYFPTLVAKFLRMLVGFHHLRLTTVQCRWHYLRPLAHQSLRDERVQMDNRHSGEQAKTFDAKHKRTLHHPKPWETRVEDVLLNFPIRLCHLLHYSRKTAAIISHLHQQQPTLLPPTRWTWLISASSSINTCCGCHLRIRSFPSEPLWLGFSRFPLPESSTSTSRTRKQGCYCLLPLFPVLTSTLVFKRDSVE